MNVLYVLGWPLGQGGHINSTLSLIENLREVGKVKNIVIIAPYGEKVNQFKKCNVNYFNIRKYQSSFYFNTHAIFLIIYTIIRHKIDVIHAMDYKALKPTIIANLFCWNKIVYTKAGGEPITTPLPKVGAFIVFSNELKSYYEENKFGLNNMYLIKERINLKEFVPEEIKTPNPKVFTVFIAMRLAKAKDGLLNNLFRELLQVNSTGKVINIVIAGDGDLMKYCQEKSQEIQKRNKHLRFEFLGEVFSKDIILMYNKTSDLIVGHGRGILEAMAVGKPVVLLGFDCVGSVLVKESNIYQITDFNFSGRNLIFNNDDQSLSDILNNEKFQTSLKSIGILNRNFIEKEYDAIIGAERTWEIYKRSHKSNYNDFKENIKWLAGKIRVK